MVTSDSPRDCKDSKEVEDEDNGIDEDRDTGSLSVSEVSECTDVEVGIELGPTRTSIVDISQTVGMRRLALI